MPDVELTEERKPLASAEEDRKEFAETFREGAEASQFVKRPILRRTLIAATAPLALAPLVLLRDLGPLPGTALRHTVWRKGLRLVISDTGRPIRPADFDSPGAMITVIPEGYQNDDDALVKATAIIIKFEPGQLQPPTNHELDGGQHRRLLEDLHPRRLPGRAVRADHPPHPVPMPPVHLRRPAGAPRCCSARRPGRCRSCRWARTPRDTWSR